MKVKMIVIGSLYNGGEFLPVYNQNKAVSDPQRPLINRCFYSCRSERILRRYNSISCGLQDLRLRNADDEKGRERRQVRLQEHDNNTDTGPEPGAAPLQSFILLKRKEAALTSKQRRKNQSVQDET